MDTVRNYSSDDESSTDNDNDQRHKHIGRPDEEGATKRIKLMRSTSSSSSFSSGTLSTLTPSPPPATSRSTAALTDKTTTKKNMDDKSQLKAQLEDQTKQKSTEATSSSSTAKAKAENGASSGSTTESTEEKDVFDIQAIVGHKKVKGQDLWRVRWVNYGPDDDTWEPIENLLSDYARQLVAEYEAKENVKKEQRLEMARRSDEYKRQKLGVKEEPNTDEEKEEVDLNGSNVEGWFGIKRGQGTREQQRLFVPDRRLSKTEKLLTEISTPGNRVLRNHLRAQSREKSFTPGYSPASETRKRGRPTKKSPRQKLLTTNVSDLFTSDGGSPAQMRTRDKSAKKNPQVKKPKINEESAIVAETFTSKAEKVLEEKALPQRDLKVEEKKKAKGADNEPKPATIVPVERPASTSSSVKEKEKEFGVSKKLAIAKRTSKKEHKRPKEDKIADETAHSTSKHVEKKKPKHTPSVDLSLKELPKGADIGAELEKIFMKRQEIQTEAQEISQHEFEENVLDGKVEKVRQILMLNAQKPFLNLDHCDDSGKTLIHRLCEIKCGVSHTQCELIHLLVTNGARLDVREANNGQIPLHLAIAHRRTCHMLKLLELQSPVNLPDRTGKPPIMLALDCSDNMFIRSLLKNGASFNLAMEKVYRDKERFRRPMRIMLEHETRLRRALNSARDNVTMNMTVKCVSPIFVHPLHESELVHTFQLATQPQLPSPNSAYMIFCGVAEFTVDNSDLDSCSNIEASARMWGRSPVLSAYMNGKECVPLKPSANNFAFLCVPMRDQNQVKLKLDPGWRDSELVLLSQMVLCTFNAGRS